MAMFNIPKPLKPRGIRFSLPGGFVLGRVSPGMGDAELIPIDQLAQAQLKTGIIAPGPVAGGGSTAPVVGAMINSFSGLNKNRYLPLAALPAAVTMPAASPADLVTCRVAPTSNVVLYIVHDPATYEVSRTAGYLGYITILASSLTGTVTWTASPTTLARGTVLYLYTEPANGVDSSIAVDTTFTVLEILLTADAA